MREDKEKNSQIVEQDIVEEYSGDVWNFQLLVAFLLAFPGFSYNLHYMNVVFLAPPISYTCLDNVTNSSEAMQNICPCENPEYDRSTFDETIIMTWDLICNRQWLVSVSQTGYQIGVLAGSLIFGFLSDKFGRKKSFITGHILQLISGVALGFVTEFWMYTFLRFAIGVSIGCYLGVGFVLQMEVTTKSKRDIISIIFRIPKVLGLATLALLAYCFRHWRYLEIALSLPITFLFLFVWVLPESPRWNLAKGRDTEAIATIKRMAKINRYPSEGIERAVEIYEEKRKNQPKDKNTGNILDLIRNPFLMKNLIILSFIWMGVSFFYVGVNTYVGQLSGNIFLNITFLAIVGIPYLFGGHILTKYAKRRPSMILSLLASAVSMFLISSLKIFPNDLDYLNVIFACLGSALIGMTFIVVYLITAEIIPTEVRNAAFGITSVFARLGSIAATFVAYFEVFGAWVPSFIFGTSALVLLCLSYFLEETKGFSLMKIIKVDEKNVRDTK